MTRSPTVTVVIPTYNEERHLRSTLDSIAVQTYPAIAEIIVVDGRSTDRTRAVAEAVDAVRLVDNPERIQAAGLNRSLEIARGEVIVRVDGHCVLAPDYVDACVAALEQTGAAIVGGAMTPAADLVRSPSTQRA